LRTDGSRTGVGGPPWFSEYGFQQTRAFRALKVWMALRHHGLSGYRAAIEHDLSLAERLSARVRRTPDLELFTPQNLSIVCFRYAPLGLRSNGVVLNAINQTILERLQLNERAFLSSTVIDDTFWLRAGIVNYRATEADVDLLTDLVMRIGTAIDTTRPAV
jgi:aromatic-L-amino-acid decarboxylase